MSEYTENLKNENCRKLAKLLMLTENIKEGISTNYIDKLGYEFIRDNGGYSAPLYYEVSKNLYAHL